MAKKLIIKLTLEDEDDWRCSSEVRRVIPSREYEHLRGGPKSYVEAEAGRMWEQLHAGEEFSHG